MFIIDYRNAKRDLLAIDLDELRTMDLEIVEKLHGNPFQNLFTSISNEITTRGLTIQGTTDRPTPSTDLSRSSEGVTTEGEPRAILENLVAPFLKNRMLVELDSKHRLAQ